MSDIHYKGQSIKRYDAVIPRIGASITRYGTAVVRQFELCGTVTLNSSDSILKARDKLMTHQLLSGHGIPMPLTVFGDNPDDTEDLLSLIGGGACVIKLSASSQGSGVILTKKVNASRSVIETLRGLNADFLVQQYIPESKGCDIRCIVINGEVIATMRRRAAVGEFRSNIHRGGVAEAFTPTEEVIDLARRASSALGLKLAGVDILLSNNGPLVLEVNSSPGLEGIEKVTGRDIAGNIIDYVISSISVGK